MFRKTSRNGFVFLDVPNDILLLVLHKLELKSLVQFCQTTKKIYHWSLKNESLWQDKCLKYVRSQANTFGQDEDTKLLRMWQNYDSELSLMKSKKSWWRNQLIEYYTLYGNRSYFPRKLSSTFEGIFDTEKVFNVVAVGAGATGKTQAIERYAQGSYIDKYDPTIEGSYTADVRFGDQSFAVDLLDTAGQEEYAALRDHYTAKADGVLIFYSITTRSSFEHCAKLNSQIQRVKNNDNSFPVILVGAKSDLESERVVPTTEGIALAKRWNIPFLEVSAKTDFNVQQLFERITLEMVHYTINYPPNTKRTSRRRPNRGSCVII